MTAPLDTSIPLPIGTRVKYSSEWLRHLYPYRVPVAMRKRGTISGMARTTGCRVVKWDDLRQSVQGQTISIDFLEIAE